MRSRLLLPFCLTLCLGFTPAIASVATSSPLDDLVPDPITLPPDLLPATPAEGRYLDPTFTFSRTQQDVAYGQALNSRGELQTLTLDVYEPDDDTEAFRPVVVWVHGGFFVEGSKNSVDFLHELTSRGYVTVSINYRLRPDMARGIEEILLTPEVADNVQEAVQAVKEAQYDAQAAVRWVRANAEALRIDADRIAIAGHSAGGITAWAVNYNPNDVGDSGNPGFRSDVAAGISSAGAFAHVLSGMMQPGDTPALGFHGTHDTIVPYVTTPLACGVAIGLGNVCEFHTYVGAEHNNMPRPDRGARSAEFLHRHVLTAPRVTTAIVDTWSMTQGEQVAVGGRLIDAAGRPLADEPVAVQAVGGWVSVRTGDDGSFVGVLTVPDHGQSTTVEVRYHAHRPGHAPSTAAVTATWGNRS